MNYITNTNMVKKILNIGGVFLLIFLLSSCFGSKESIDNAKKELWVIKVDETKNNTDTWGNIDVKEDTDDIETEEKIIEEKEKNIEINYLTEDKFLLLDDLTDENLLDWEVEITWKTIWKVDKIIVSFENTSSEFPFDSYTLKQFVSGDTDFLYRAFSRYETLDFWKNTYIFEAYSWDKVSKLELILNVVKEEEKEISEKIDKVFEDISITSLPVESTFSNQNM